MQVRQRYASEESSFLHPSLLDLARGGAAVGSGQLGCWARYRHFVSGGGGWGATMARGIFETNSGFRLVFV